MSEPTRIFITEKHPDPKRTDKEKAARAKSLFSIFFITLGTVLLAVAAYGLFGTLYASCGIIGVVVLVVGVLLGTGTSG